MSEVSEKLSRVSVPALDEILGVPFKVLDDGFVRLVDYMGNDSSIVQAARVSYGAGTKRVSEDRGLIRYLMRHWHTTPFEMCEIKLHVRVPMDCWRQWIRHRTANVNEYSTRYSEAIDACQKTSPEDWRLQSELNKQGSGGKITEWPNGHSPIVGLSVGDEKIDLKTPGEYLTHQEKKLQEYARDLYEERLLYGVAREQARKDLPLSTYTEAYWKVDLHNLFHFLRLRMDSHAQKEIRDYACTIGEKIVKVWCPLAWEAYMDYQFGAAHLSRMEMEIIAAVTTNGHVALRLAESYGWLEKNEKGVLKTNRERTEVEAKLKKLNLTVPW